MSLHGTMATSGLDNKMENLEVTFFLIVLIVALLLVSIQDLPLARYGELFRTPFIWYLLLNLPFWMYHLFRSGLVKFSSIEKSWIVYVFYVVVLSCFFSFIFSLENNMTFLKENLITKGFKVIGYYLVFFLSIIFFRYLFCHLSSKYSLIAFFVDYVVLFFILVLELISRPHFTFLHENFAPYYRIRLLTHESSWAGSLMAIYLLCALIFLKLSEGSVDRYLYRTIRVVMILIFSVFLIFSGSKGLYLSLFFSAVLYLIYSIVKLKHMKLIFISAIVLFLLVPFIVITYGNLYVDVKYYSSLSTRFVLMQSAINTFVKYPFGVGVSYLYPQIVEEVKTIINSSYFIHLGLSHGELLKLCSSYKGLAIKSFFFQNIAVGGIVFLSFFFYLVCIFLKVLKRYELLRNPLIFILTIYVVLSLLVYMNVDIKYQYAALMGLLSSLQLKIERKSHR